jgi:hypothetical protein
VSLESKYKIVTSAEESCLEIVEVEEYLDSTIEIDYNILNEGRQYII